MREQNSNGPGDKAAELKLGATHKPSRRKNIRLPAANYLGRRSYFITMCFDRRRRFGANARLARWLTLCLRKHALACEFFVHAYCIMPDHIHVLAVGGSGDSNLVKFVESFKQATAVDFAYRTGQRLWQVKYYDHILRRADAEDRVAWYIWMNPVRKCICRAPGDYPFSGSFTQIGIKLLQNFVPPHWTPPWKKKARPANSLDATFAGTCCDPLSES